MKRWFNYTGTDEAGREVSGALSAESYQEATAEVEARQVKLRRLYEMDWVKVLRDSLRCYTCGWLAFVPVVGVIAAIRAMVLFGRVRTQVGTEWSAASRYLVCGYLLAWLGGLFSLSSSLLLVAYAIKMMLAVE